MPAIRLRVQRLVLVCQLALCLLLLLAVSAKPVMAQEGQPPTPHDLPWAWNVSPALLLQLGLATWLYVRGWRVLRQRTGSTPRLWNKRAWAFGAGLVLLAVAVISPLDALSGALFSAHMAQHMVLVLLAAPLLVLGAPIGPMLLGLPAGWRVSIGRGWKQAAGLRRVWRAVSHPATAWGLHALVLWVWHVPSLYQAALLQPALHALEHVCFLGTAVLFWWAVAHPRRRHSLTRGPGGALYIFTMAVQSGLLGALITFASQPWYPAYAETSSWWGLTALEDQQLAGAIMWIPAGIVYVVGALAVLGAWFYEMEAVERGPQRETWAAG